MFKTEEGIIKGPLVSRSSAKQLGTGSKMKVRTNKQTEKKINQGKQKVKFQHAAAAQRSCSTAFLLSRGSPGKWWRFIFQAKFPREPPPRSAVSCLASPGPAALQRRGAPSCRRLRGAGFCFKAREGISAQSLISADQPGEGGGGGVEIRAGGIK